jgi:hypothetical protein
MFSIVNPVDTAKPEVLRNFFGERNQWEIDKKDGTNGKLFVPGGQ